MSKYVIAGKSDCPFYARAELLADELKLRLPEFSIHKIVLNPSDWDEWLTTTCNEKGWKYEGGSPLIWRELINRGGKGNLVGSCNDFLEMAKGYYGITCSKKTEELLAVSNENREIKEIIDEEESEKLSSSTPFQVTITDAISPLAYNILPHLCSGNTLENYKEVSLTLLCNEETSDDINKNVSEIMSGLAMELEDLSQSQMKEVTTTSSADEAFATADLIIMLNSSQELNHEYLIKLKEYGLSLNVNAKSTTKILFAGQNSMACCYILSQIASNIPSQNFLAMSRFEENKIKSIIGKKLEINPAGVSNLLIWGSSNKFIVDYENSVAYGYNGAIWAPHLNEFSHSVKEIIYDKNFLDEELPQQINSEDNTKLPKIAMSCSAALITQIKDMMCPSNQFDIFSLGLVSQGQYDIPDGLVFSFPVTHQNGEMKVKTNLNITEIMKKKIKTCALEFETFCKNLLESIQ